MGYFSVQHTTPTAGPITVAALGLLFFLSYIAFILVHGIYRTGPTWLFSLGVILISILSIGLMYGGYWLWQSEFTQEEHWEVAIWLFAGMIGALALTFWPIFYQRIVGVAIEDPVFILLISSGLGANAGLVAGIYQIHSERQVREVQRARDSLEFLNRLLRHNILNAVTVIHGNASLLSDATTPREIDNNAQIIQKHSNEITDLIRNVGIIVQQAETDIELTAVDLTAIVEDEVVTIRNTFPDAVIDTNLAPSVMVRANPLISAGVKNIIDNAIQHNDANPPKVTITITATPEIATLSISDNGPGLSVPTPESLIEPGEHGDRGLGLYIVDTLVDQFNGTLKFETNNPRGTTVTITLPTADQSSLGSGQTERDTG